MLCGQTNYKVQKLHGQEEFQNVFPTFAVLKKNTASFKLFGVGQVTPYKPSIYFNKCGYMVLPVLINKSKEICLFTSSNVVYNTVDSAVSALYGQLLTQANTLLKPSSN